MIAVLSEVAYSFIGIGITYPNYSLGSLISDAAQQLNTLPHMFWFPVIFFFLLVGPLSAHERWPARCLRPDFYVGR